MLQYQGHYLGPIDFQEKYNRLESLEIPGKPEIQQFLTMQETQKLSCYLKHACSWKQLADN